MPCAVSRSRADNNHSIEVFEQRAKSEIKTAFKAIELVGVAEHESNPTMTSHWLLSSTLAMV